MIRYITIILLVLAGCQPSLQKNFDPASFVDTFIGTGGEYGTGFGNTYPGAAYPFGMIQLSPDNGGEGWEYSSGYHYADSVISGFSHTHLSGTGVGDLCDISLMPTTKETGNEYNILKYRATFSHEKEKASPGYYFVNLREDNIDAELTTSEFVGMHRYKFRDKNEQQHLILNIGFNINRDKSTAGSITRREGGLITGYRFSTGWARLQKVFFAMEFSNIPESLQYFNADTVRGRFSASGKDLACVFTFDGKISDELLVKVAISSASEDGAIANLHTADKYGWNFDRMHSDTRKKWNDELSKVTVSTPDLTQKKIFYSALYHCYLAPSRFSDADGFYKNFQHLPEKAEGYIHYTVLSLWDTFRAEKPLLAMMQPALYNNIVISMLAKYRQTGELPYWELEGNEGGSMIGYHSVPVIADAILKNIGSFDKELAFKAMIDASETDRKGLDFYREFHFVPVDKGKNGTVSKTLEYCFDDWCIAQVAKYLGKDAEYRKYMDRSQYYRNLYDPQYMLMRGRNSDGSWYEPFHPRFAGYGNEHTVEGDTWQYSFFVPHDFQGLMDLMGGSNGFSMMLDSLFCQTSELLGEDTEDVTGMVGQYSHGNEPDHHAPYLYHLVGKLEKTQYYTNKIIDSLYSASPDGLCGNEDCGQMSAWYVFSSMGFYPVNPLESKYYFGSPQFRKVEISLPGGKKFIVKAENVSEKNIYSREIKLNGKKLDRTFITYEEIINGGILDFDMTDNPGSTDVRY